MSPRSKKLYEPPKIYELGGPLDQARGQRCIKGVKPEGACVKGNKPGGGPICLIGKKPIISF